MLLLEPLHITEPADAVAQSSDRQLDHHFLIFAVVIMGKDRFLAAFFVDDQPELDVEFLDTRNICSRHRIGTVQNNAGINISKSHMILFPIVRKKNTDTFIEIKFDALYRIHCRYLRNFTVNTRLLGLFRLRHRSRRRCSIYPYRKITCIIIRIYGKIIHFMLHFLYLETKTAAISHQLEIAAVKKKIPRLRNPACLVTFK